jgi:diphthine-ammonia ligase
MCAVFFSGGKDSMLALDRVTRSSYHVAQLVTLYDGASEHVRFHGVPIALMQAQAKALDIPSLLCPTTPENFEQVFLQALGELRADGVNALVFGDIHLADVRGWYEDRVRAAGMLHVEPLWGEEPTSLVHEMLTKGYTAIITCIEEATADPAWLGQTITGALVEEFVQRGIDPCGERGEYHTFVVDGPLFQRPLAVTLGTERQEQGFRQLQVSLADDGSDSGMPGSPT